MDVDSLVQCSSQKEVFKNIRGVFWCCVVYLNIISGHLFLPSALYPDVYLCDPKEQN